MGIITFVVNEKRKLNKDKNDLAQEHEKRVITNEDVYYYLKAKNSSKR